MRGCWALLGDMLGEARAKGLAANGGAKYLEALAAGVCVLRF